MATLKDVAASQAHIQALLAEAIGNWQPERPRRWLAKYGNWPVELRNSASPISKQYLALREEAMRRSSRLRGEGERGVPSHTMHLDK